jgi:hypothetical protein
MASHIRRRELIVALGGAAAWALPAHTQQAAMPVIGFLHPGWPTEWAHLVAAFKDGLGEPASSRAKTWRSNTAGRKANTIDCRSWHPSWYADRSAIRNRRLTPEIAYHFILQSS